MKKHSLLHTCWIISQLGLVWAASPELVTRRYPVLIPNDAPGIPLPGQSLLPLSLEESLNQDLERFQTFGESPQVQEQDLEENTQLMFQDLYMDMRDLDVDGQPRFLIPHEPDAWPTLLKQTLNMDLHPGAVMTFDPLQEVLIVTDTPENHARLHHGLARSGGLIPQFFVQVDIFRFDADLIHDLEREAGGPLPDDAWGPLAARHPETDHQHFALHTIGRENATLDLGIRRHYTDYRRSREDIQVIAFSFHSNRSTELNTRMGRCNHIVVHLHDVSPPPGDTRPRRDEGRRVPAQEPEQFIGEFLVPHAGTVLAARKFLPEENTIWVQFLSAVLVDANGNTVPLPPEFQP